ncbi:DoxX-like family protein [Gillisia sp. Hel1_33_143]|uniref:DoxX family protein n=1 Tax=Gillisia sp. Hel1_33_143 TaxID=1336796 RepID=UPI000879D446|nr:DoxX family protein [Gillisia sp. Hel1_33_143]SDS59172.1 DoxX-like family protein [Gillisia sp. Hel1_33_143]
MDYITIAVQLIVGLSILNVWLIQYNKNTQWRGGDATTIKEEFAAYGLPVWSLYVIGFLKVTLAIALICGIWFSELIKPAAIGLAVLLTGSILMHLKINDPLKKSLPAFLFLVLCLLLIFVL